MQLLLCGGGSGEQNASANQKLNEIIDHTKPILYIPLAMDESDHPYDSCYEWIHTELRNVDVSHIEMVRTYEELASKDLHQYSALFIGGGNTYQLLFGLKQSGAFQKIKEYIENDGIVIGGSAGAVIFGKDIDIISSMDPNNVNLTDTAGFNVLSGISIFPHYTNKRSSLSDVENEQRHNKFTNAIEEFSIKNGNVIAIPEEDAIYVNGDSVEIIGTGPYYIFENGVRTAKNPVISYTMRQYTDNDYNFVFEVKKNAYKKYVEQCWGEWNEQDQQKYYDNFINQVKDNAYIIQLGNEDIGFYNGEVLESGNYEVGNICIIPEYQGKGIGSRILKDIIDRYSDTDIEIQFFKQNPVGNLYERLGFEKSGETQFHYQMIKPKI